MENVRPWCGQPSDRGRLKNRTLTHNCLSAFCPRLPRQAGTRRNIHPLTPILIVRHPLSTSSIYNDPCRPLCQYTCLTVFFNNRLQVLFGLPLGLGPSTSYSLHFFTQSSSSFHSTCSYHRSLFCCNTSAVSYIPNLSLSSLLSFSLTPHIHLNILISSH